MIRTQLDIQREASEVIVATALNYGIEDTLRSIPLGAFPIEYHPFVLTILKMEDQKVDGNDTSALVGLLNADHGNNRDWIAELIKLKDRSSTPYTMAWQTNVLLRSYSAIRSAMMLERAVALAVAGDIEDAAAAARKAADVAEDTAAVGDTDIEESADIAIALQHDLDNGKGASTPVWVGFRWADENLGGILFALGRLIVVGARPGVGKTALGLNLAAGAARNVPTLYWCGEMMGTELMARLAAARGDVCLTAILDGKMAPADAAKVKRALGDIASLPLTISTRPGMTVERIDAVIRKMARQGRKPLMVVLDYLQIMGMGKTGRSREEEIGATSKALKQIAQTHNICVVLMSQLNRELEKRGNKKAQMSDLRESGSIEQDADGVVFPHRPCLYDPSVDVRAASVDIQKNRGGVANVEFQMIWDGPTQLWRDA
jgi:replicative DNA helicase